MKKLFILLAVFVLCSCGKIADYNSTESAPVTTFDLTKEGIESYFEIQQNYSTHKTVIKPFYNKHLVYENVELFFTATYQNKIPTGNYSYQIETVRYEYAAIVDQNGYAEVDHVRSQDKNTVIYSAGTNSYVTDLTEVSGTISFSEENIRIQNLKNKKHTETLTVNYDYVKGNFYLSFKTDNVFLKNPNTDAFYSIESVRINFSTVINNVNKDFEYTLFPDINGMCNLAIDVDSLFYVQNLKCYYTNAFFIYYE